MHHLTAIADPKIKDCIDNCSSCADVCRETMTHCLEIGGNIGLPGPVPDSHYPSRACRQGLTISSNARPEQTQPLIALTG